jgi:uncharacterized protein YndB with AHSA1/START domain
LWRVKAIAEPVVIVRNFPAPIERVFLAWSNAEFLKQWFALGATWVESAEIDFRPGGDYRIVVADAEGSNSVFGRYRRITEPTLLEFTWQWQESTFETGISLVTIQLQTAESQTQMTLTHAQLSSELSIERHAFGWDKVLQRLSLFASA